MIFNQIVCQRCMDTIGPWCMYKDHETRKPIFICEDCWEELVKELKKDDTTDLRDQRHAR